MTKIDKFNKKEYNIIQIKFLIKIVQIIFSTNKFHKSSLYSALLSKVNFSNCF